MLSQECALLKDVLFFFSLNITQVPPLWSALSLLGARDSYAINNEAFIEIVEFHILMIKLSLATNEIESFAGAINRARGTCWACAGALVRDRARLTETPGFTQSPWYSRDNAYNSTTNPWQAALRLCCDIWSHF